MQAKIIKQVSSGMFAAYDRGAREVYLPFNAKNGNFIANVSDIVDVLEFETDTLRPCAKSWSLVTAARKSQEQQESRTNETRRPQAVVEFKTIEVKFDRKDRRQFRVMRPRKTLGNDQLAFGTLIQLANCKEKGDLSDPTLFIEVRENGAWIRCKSNPLDEIAVKVVGMQAVA